MGMEPCFLFASTMESEACIQPGGLIARHVQRAWRCVKGRLEFVFSGPKTPSDLRQHPRLSRRRSLLCNGEVAPRARRRLTLFLHSYAAPDPPAAQRTGCEELARPASRRESW